MFKIFVFLLFFGNTIAVEYYLARVLVLSEENSAKNSYMSVKYADGKKPTQSVNNGSCSASNKIQEDLIQKNTVKRFNDPDDIIVTWKKPLYVKDQSDMKGVMTVKYENNKHPEKKAEFVLCDLGKSVPRQLFDKLLIHGFSKTYKCVEQKDVKVSDGYYYDLPSESGIYCNTNATIRLDVFGMYSADCGLGGSGETFSYHIFRAVFNARFENCDGQKYKYFDDYDPGLLEIAKLSTAKKITDELGKRDII